MFKRLCELNAVFTERLTFFVVYRLCGFLQSKILLQFLKFQEKKIVIAEATMLHCRALRYTGACMIYYFVVFGFATVVQHVINTMIVLQLASTLR